MAGQDPHVDRALQLASVKWRGLCPFRLISLALLSFVVSGVASAQSQLVTEQNIGDAILGRQIFVPEVLNSLDVNLDGVVDIADLVFHLLQSDDLVASVSFARYSSDTWEGENTAVIPLVFTKALDTPATLSYTLGGTATYGPKSSGGDYTVAGYDPSLGIGLIDVEAGATGANLVVTVHDDAVFGEGKETVNFMLTEGDLMYFLGVQQDHVLYINENDSVWLASLNSPEGGGYQSFAMEIIQEEGVWSGRLLADGKLIPTPEAGDANRDGDDGWVAVFYSGSQSLRIEIGPIPVDKSFSFFDADFSRHYLIEVEPGWGTYQYYPRKRIVGVATETLEPVEGRLGRASHRRAYLRRESTGSVVLLKQPSMPTVGEVPLEDAG